ncbi:hypothetical protein AC1031_014971 [Aphanomyces cochlioides]|nr:hypothetical protein AC1031_020282 [Aphanomyces cochlioides]KAG9397743.1 hypothetical protein AC1031_017940 [Aphanomyces cochlioides]KAG9398056.1 hypothetical protein AC1031_014973 [Aphanomyces cochlioides]KAG9398173.1 hypothetical protein AC1031_014971 [Aphanomyces cochlioides]
MGTTWFAGTTTCRRDPWLRKVGASRHVGLLLFKSINLQLHLNAGTFHCLVDVGKVHILAEKRLNQNSASSNPIQCTSRANDSPWGFRAEIDRTQCPPSHKSIADLHGVSTEFSEA